MSYYRTCPNCGAALDPGEICECVQQERDRQAFLTAIQEPEKRAAERESRKMRVQLVGMICSMNDEQFAWFIEQARERLPELRETCNKINEMCAERAPKEN